MKNEIKTTAHSTYRCQYHIVFAPKYRRKVIYNELRADIGQILRKLCNEKKVELIEAEACPDHIHMLVSIPPYLSVAQFMGFLKSKSALMIFDRHANLKYKYGNNTAELYEWNFEWIEKYREYYINEAVSLVRVDIDRSELTEEMLIDAANECAHYTKWCKMDDSSFCCVYELDSVSVNLNDATFCFARFNGDEESLNRVLKCCNKNNSSRYGKFEVFAKENEHGVWLCGRMTELYTYKEVNESYITEACKNTRDARKFIQDVQKIAKKYDANYYIVTDGASATNNNGNPAVKVARDAVAEWERKNGFDDKEDWSNNPDDFSNYRLKESSINESLEVPDNYNNDTQSVVELLDNTDPKRIFLSSDWHFYSLKYKKEKNAVNTREIVSWCKNNIKDEDVFMYLGDMCFRWASDEDNKKVQELFKSLPGIKILILGNHDIVAGEDFYLNCGFDYVLNELVWHDYIFSHRPINISNMNYVCNIHGHKH